MTEIGLSFGRVAELYDRVRPPYLPASLDRAQEALGLEESAEVLDLAAGTGRLTEELAKRFARVIAVEPNDAMRERIRSGEVLAGSAEEVPLPDASVDAVFVGEAIHWFDADRAVPEMARVLRPGGGLARFSNQWFQTEPPLPANALELMTAIYRASGRLEVVENWREAFARSPFQPLRDEHFDWKLPVDPNRLVGLYRTTSSFAALPEDEHAALAAELRVLLDRDYVLPIRVELTWTRLPA